MTVFAKLPLLLSGLLAKQIAHAEPAKDFTKMLAAEAFIGRIDNSRSRGAAAGETWHALCGV
ncbi:hypothetical protein [Shimia sp. MIT1388]|uniref:hypothetical protein n=1 Tax=Shimia sp. MIT1388 TaxID=3096992 RepID=UPI00399BD887